MTNNELKRLDNTEKALVALWNLIEDTMPPEYQESANSMMEEFYNSNVSLGADFGEKETGYFHINPEL